jgi:hypothetical protein
MTQMASPIDAYRREFRCGVPNASASTREIAQRPAQRLAGS